MRVGANAKQYARIKKLHAQNVDPAIIAASIPMTAQSLEHILAHLDDRKEVILEVDNSPAVEALRGENAELLARLAKYEELPSGPQEDASEKVEAVRTEGQAEGEGQGQAQED